MDIEIVTFMEDIKRVFGEYQTYGSRSSKKTDMLHTAIKERIDDIIKKWSTTELYSCEIEKNVRSENASGIKSCDVVVFKKGEPHIVFPVKFIMTNYKQNKNNSYENLTGELSHIKWANPDIYIIPINIIFNNIPYLTQDKKIKRFETILYENSFNIYEKMKEHKIAFDMMNYIIDVKHTCSVNEYYDKCPELIGFNQSTPFRSFDEIFGTLLM